MVQFLPDTFLVPLKVLRSQWESNPSSTLPNHSAMTASQIRNIYN